MNHEKTLEATTLLSTPQAYAHQTQHNPYFSARPPQPNYKNNRSDEDEKKKKPMVYCQISTKPGHTGKTCKYQYTKPSSRNNRHNQPRAYYVAHYAAPPPPSSHVPPPQQHYEWFLDSGATHHITPEINNMSSVSSYTGNEQIIVGNGSGPSLPADSTSHHTM